MAVWDKKILILWGFMFLLAGAVGQSVNYPRNVCAMKGSTVTLPCTFKTLKSVTENGKEVLIKINRVVWCPNHLICQGSTPSVYDSESKNNNPRYRYLGDKNGNCTLQITNLQKEDNATFRFRVETNRGQATFAGPPGVNVTVNFTQMEIKTESNGEFKRGETLTLKCNAMCTFHQLEVTWFRDGNALPETGPTLQLGPLAAKDSGNYTCGLTNNSITLSQPYSLHVEDEEEAGDVNLPLIAGVVVGVLLAVFTLVLVLCIIKRKQAATAADQLQPSVEGEQKRPDIIYSDIQHPAEQEPQEDISYAAVQFKQKNQARPAAEAEDGVIYSSVASRG
ncbi:low affinity immunoglobulin gamma Fc region receptor II-b-like [Epinephelus moara]|uniref:low affinity immunoglobulin gamma Fc region receptor II-b-like n=1 Tax=Epinephelus moara TaxID=300413 RepID=UPI00214E2E00|nr:low affinity immunoglobulin gamma Fc region receptor II-b-like [Epinephelus moara]